MKNGIFSMMKRDCHQRHTVEFYVALGEFNNICILFLSFSLPI